MHKAQQILDAIYTKLLPLVSSSAISELLKNRAQPPLTFPAVVIRMGSDSPTESSNSSFIDSALTVQTDIYITSTDTELDTKTLDVRTEIHKALMTDRSLGLGFVIDSKPLGQSEPDYTGDGQDYAGATRLSWEINYRSSFDNPEL